MKNKTLKKSIVAIMIFSLVAMYGYMPIANAASLTNVSDLISDSDVSATGVTHTVSFTTGQPLALNYTIDITFPAEVTGILVGNVTCPSDASESVVGQVVTCTVVTPLAAGDYSVVVANTVNTATAGDYMVEMVTQTNASVEIENGQMRFYIIDDVTMSAHVDPTLEFTIQGTSTGAVLIGALTCTQNTTATTTDFGTLAPGSSETVCQELRVTTNATNGFTVTVEQDHELLNTTGDNINSFNNSPDNTGSTTAQAWAIPDGVLDVDYTYGHMGVTSNDTDLSGLGGYNDFYNSGTANYAGLNSTDPMPVYHHDGPADGSTQDKGYIMVGYTAEINALQQAGDYQNTLTYIATATY